MQATLFDGFYPQDQGDLRLADRLKAVSNLPPTLVVYGTADDRILPGYASDLIDGLLRSIGLLEMSGMAHRIGPISERRVIRDALGDFADK